MVLKSTMIENPSSWGPERGKHFYQVSQKATHMVAERLNLEGLGLELIKLPLCTEAEAVAIEELLPRAKEGFALTLKAQSLTTGQVPDLLRLTTPESVSGLWPETKLTERQNTLSEYGHVFATLALLREIGKVSFFDFASPPSEIDVNLGRVLTFWHQDCDAEHLWTTLSELENSIRAILYQKQPMGTRELLKVGHFFAAGQEISEVFN